MHSNWGIPRSILGVDSFPPFYQDLITFMMPIQRLQMRWCTTRGVGVALCRRILQHTNVCSLQKWCWTAWQSMYGVCYFTGLNYFSLGSLMIDLVLSHSGKHCNGILRWSNSMYTLEDSRFLCSCLDVLVGFFVLGRLTLFGQSFNKNTSSQPALSRSSADTPCSALTSSPVWCQQ